MFRRRPIVAILALAPFVSALTGAAGAATTGLLVPHRAVYDLELKDASERSGIAGMYGRMVYEFNGSPCEGYTVSFRFVTQVDNGEGVRLSDQQTTTYEDLKGRNFRFLTRTFTDEALDKEVRGSAHDGPDGVKVDLSAPEKREVSLADGLFPTAHMMAVIDRAKKGERFFEQRIFDGSDAGDKTLLTTTTIGARTAPKGDDAEASKADELATAAYWPVTIAYFDDKSSGDSLPIYRMTFKLYENGVTRDLTMDYGDFVLSGRLTDLELFKQESCE
ncbi:cell envelope integrity EipB family protein [Ensifer soli]|uniref:cell envelope integrity EipB family protein n=1 Tax=Ciceribacter sp. sgz301302 TaxID=3342379 RepID=UPI0035BB7516